MKVAKTSSTQRVAAMRAARDALGLRRLELYAHPDDWPTIKAFAEACAECRKNYARLRTLQSAAHTRSNE